MYSSKPILNGNSDSVTFFSVKIRKIHPTKFLSLSAFIGIIFVDKTLNPLQLV